MNQWADSLIFCQAIACKTIKNIIVLKMNGRQSRPLLLSHWRFPCLSCLRRSLVAMGVTSGIKDRYSLAPTYSPAQPLDHFRDSLGDCPWLWWRHDLQRQHSRRSGCIWAQPTKSLLDRSDPPTTSPPSPMAAAWRGTRISIEFEYTVVAWRDLDAGHTSLVSNYGYICSDWGLASTIFGSAAWTTVSSPSIAHLFFSSYHWVLAQGCGVMVSM